MSGPPRPAVDPAHPRAAAALIELTLDALEREARDSWDTVAACLRVCPVGVVVEGWDGFVLTTARDRPVAVETGSEPAAAVDLDRVALDALASGRSSIVDLVEAGHAAMRGPSSDLARLTDLPAALIEGIMRSPTAQVLWDRFLQDAEVSSSEPT